MTFLPFFVLAQEAQKTTAAPTQEAKQQQEKSADDYGKVTKDFTKKDGVFAVWTKGEEILFEVKQKVQGRDFVWVTELRDTPAGSYSGTAVSDRIVRWEQRGDKVLLRSVNYSVRARDGGAIAKAVEQSSVLPIIQVFDVKAKSPDGDPVIDVSRMYKSDVAEFSVRQAMGGGPLDSQRSFVDRVSVFPDNINVHVMMTFGQGAAPAAGTGGGRRGGGGAGPSNTGVVSHSMAILPEEPMQGRLWDSRVGYFSTSWTDYATEAHGAKNYRFIARYRLDKKNPAAAVSEPVKPIVYYVSNEVPEKWRPYVKKGIEDWQPAFEAAGFKNAIVAKDPPGDPDWSPEDARYSVIRWAPMPIANAIGPHVHDPRSGEIISAHVIMWHDILRLQSNWYFAQASAQDPRAQKLPIPDSLMGELVRFVVAHEVGHTLGFPHNGKGSAGVSIKNLRDPRWTAENGTASSIMDYARFNYVCQPGDKAALIPMVGPYDKFATHWGYAPIEAKSPWDETATLDKWASAQVDNPLLRFYDNFSGSDPTAQAEALGDDAVEASRLGTENLKRSMSFLMDATTKPGEDYTEMDQFLGALEGQFGDYIGHVLAVVGGVVLTDYHAGRGGEVYEPTSRAYQKRAVAWLMDNAVKTPVWFAPEDISWRLGSDGGAGTLAGFGSRAVNGLLQDGRLTRMRNNAVRQKAAAYTCEEMLEDVRGAVFSELGSKDEVTNVRQSVQRSYVQALVAKLAPGTTHRALAANELRNLQAVLVAQLALWGNAPSRAHFQDLADWIDFAFKNPDKAVSPATTVPSPFGAALCDDQSCLVSGPHSHLAGLGCGAFVRDPN